MHRWYKPDGRLDPSQIADYSETLLYGGLASPNPARSARELVSSA